MSYGKSEGKTAEAVGLLKNVLNEYQFISQAPTQPNDYQTIKEREKLYKSVDSSGNVYLIQNPAVWREVVNENGSRSKMRPEPELVFSFAQLKAEAEKKKDVVAELYKPRQAQIAGF